MATFDFVKIIYFYLPGSILQLKLNILQWSDKLMFACVCTCVSSCTQLTIHRAVIAGQSRPLTPHLRGQPRPQRNDDLRSWPTEEYSQ